MKQHWPVGDNDALKKKAGFGLVTLPDMHMVLFSEVKILPNKISGDLKKIAMCMKASVDRSKQLGYAQAAVCVLFVKSTILKILMMETWIPSLGHPHLSRPPGPEKISKTLSDFAKEPLL